MKTISRRSVSICILAFRQSFMAIAACALVGLSASHCAAQGTDTGDVGQTAGAGLSTGQDADEVFGSGIDRGGAIGASTVAPIGSNENATATTGRGATGGGFGGGAFGNALNSLFGGGANNQSSTPAIRTRLRSAIKVAPMNPLTVANSARQNLARLSVPSAVANVNIQMEGRTATLTGVVASEEQRRMSELLLRLEPGVSKIVNQVVVQK